MTISGDAVPSRRWRVLAAWCLGAISRSGLRSALLRNAPFALFIGGILAYGVTFAWYLLDRFDLVNLIRDVNRDDAFYYFQIAFHMADGKFSTFDGGLTRTNGYHPLWLFLITPFYWVFDKVEALYAIKAFEILLIAGGGALVAGAARVARLPWILLFAALPALYRISDLFMGMEAAAALFLLGLFLLTICLFARDPAKWRWPLTAVAFALPWVRLEYVAIAVAVTAALCLIERSGRFPAAVAGGGGVFALNAAVPLFGALAGVLGYFAYNGIVFGGIVPVSAAIKAFWSQSRWESEGGYSLAGNIHAFLQTGFFDYELLVAIEVCIYMVLVWWFSRRPRGREDWMLAFLVGVFGLAAGHLAKFAQSVLTVHPHCGSSVEWYFVPMYLMMELAVPVRCYVAVWFVRHFIGPGPHASIPSLAIFIIGAVFLFVKADFTAPFRGVDFFYEATYRERRVSAYMGTMVMNHVLPEDSVVGSWDSGRVGYFSHFPVMNLDGMVNSWDYLDAVREETEAKFRQLYGVTYWADVWRPIFQSRPYHDTTLFEGPWVRHFEMHKSEERFRIWPGERLRESWGGVDHSHWFWERMEPHLERQADGIGLLRDGRIAQAFVRVCAPDKMAVWTWTGQREPVLLPWTQTSSTGLCTSAIVLPHGALPPVRVAMMTAGEYLADRVGERQPALRSDFDVYLVENTLVYAKEPCGLDTLDMRFFLHLDAVVPDDLPDPRKRAGFDNLDFRFGDHGTRAGETCLAVVPLPEYGIAAIRTGQFVVLEGGFLNIWEAEIRFE